MAEKKAVTVNFYRLESSQDTFLDDLGYKLDAKASDEMNFGFFDGKHEYLFKVYEPIEQASGKLHLVGLCKEKTLFPVWFDREGTLTDVPLNGGSLGEVSYFLIDAVKGAVLMLSGGIGSPTISAFGDFARWLTAEPNAGTSPMYAYDALDEMLQWEIFRKVEVSVEAPASDFVGNILDSELGRNFTALDTLKGLKINLSVSMGNSKGCLHKDAVKQFVKQLIADKFAGKLLIKGKSIEEEATAEFDIYNARLKHKTEMSIAGSRISPDEARSCLYEAYQINLDDIDANTEVSDGRA